MRGLVRDWVKEDIEVAKQVVEILCETDSVARCIDIITLDQARNTSIEHIEDCKRSFFGRVLEDERQLVIVG